MYKYVSIVFYFLLLYINCHGGYTSQECLEKTNSFYKHLATKTAYRFISNTDATRFQHEACEPKRIWMVIRHGTRYPSKNLITDMKTRLLELNLMLLDNHKHNIGELCRETLDNLTSWSPQVEESDCKRLAHEGENEMVDLAERLQIRFPEILQKDYSNDTFKFRFTDTQRTLESKRYFTIGLFGRKVARYVWSPEPLHRDPILRFYKLCKKWRNEVDKNPIAIAEMVKFKESELIKMVISNVSKRLGFDKDLALDDVRLMYSTCAFEASWTPVRVSPWCGVFTENELEALEYVEDLKYYWVDGYGYDINHRQACPMMKDMIHHLTSETEPPATFYFTHSGTILKFLAHLQLYKEKKLTHETFTADRLWRSGVIDSFAANLGFILYSCVDGLKVLTLHQERTLKLPGCSEELCPLDTIKSTYHDGIYNCNFSEMCSLDNDKEER